MNKELFWIGVNKNSFLFKKDIAFLSKRMFYLLISKAMLYISTCVTVIVCMLVEHSNNWKNKFDILQNELEIKLNLKKTFLNVNVNTLKMHLF